MPRSLIAFILSVVTPHAIIALIQSSTRDPLTPGSTIVQSSIQCHRLNDPSPLRPGPDYRSIIRPTPSNGVLRSPPEGTWWSDGGGGGPGGDVTGRGRAVVIGARPTSAAGAMAEPGPASLSRRAWAAVAAEAAGAAAVYLDGPSAESLHWAGEAERLAAAAGGPGRLRAFGPRAAAGGPDERRALVVLHGAPCGPGLAALRGLLRRGRFEDCVLAAPPDDERAGRAGPPVPGLRTLAAPLPPLLPVGPHLALLPPAGPRRLAGALAALCDALGVREERFALGGGSRALAGRLARAPGRTPDAPARPDAALLCLDRTLDLAGRVTPGQLRSYIQLFKSNPKALENHCGLLQLGLATVQTLEHPHAAKWDNFLAFERLLLQSIGEGETPGLLDQLLPAVKPADRRTAGDFAPEDLLVLLVYIYSVAGAVRVGPELEGAEERLKAALADVLCREPVPSPLWQKITGCESSLKLTYPKAKTVMDELFRKLRAVSGARSALKQFGSIYTPGDHAHQASYKPLLKQVVEEIFRPDRPDPVDIEYVSSGLTDLLKTGFSMFMKVNRPHPADYPLLILFVIGGVTVAEAKMVKDLVSALKPGTQVLVLSTRLLDPRSVPELLFATDPLPPDLEF
uniref:Sec1 family domain containing 2 n=1 Tax=Ornithorhynchus anatinus TaxID=9258 RepID=F6UVF2_ORNAN